MRPVSPRRRLAQHVALLGLLAAALCLGAAPGAPPGEKSLQGVMQGLKDKLKELTAALEAKKQEPALAAVGEMERLVLLAKTHEPANLEDTPKAGRPAQVVAFRKDLIALVRALVDVEAAILDEQYDTALTTVNGQVIQMRDAGHKKYK
jgi:hypothetical protein